MKSPELRVKIRNLSQLIELVPSLFGFPPHDSLVAIAVQDGSIRVAARVDLMPPEVLHAQLAPVWQRFPVADLFLIAFTEDSQAAWVALFGVAPQVQSTGELFLLHADGHAWREHPDADPTPYDMASSVIAAETAFHGLQVRGSRAELFDSLDPSWPLEAIDSAQAALSSRGLTHDELVSEAFTLVNTLDREPRAISLDEIRLLATASYDPGFRRAVILSTTSANADSRQQVWVHVVCGSLPKTAGFALVILGVIAWVAGDGTLQVVCLQRLEGLTTDIEWMAFVDAMNRAAAPPELWEQLRVEFMCGQLEQALTAEDSDG